MRMRVKEKMVKRVREVREVREVKRDGSGSGSDRLWK